MIYELEDTLDAIEAMPLLLTRVRNILLLTTQEEGLSAAARQRLLDLEQELRIWRGIYLDSAIKNDIGTQHGKSL